MTHDLELDSCSMKLLQVGSTGFNLIQIESNQANVKAVTSNRCPQCKMVTALIDNDGHFSSGPNELTI